MANKNGNPENLKPWAPGTSGNPNGRPVIPEEIKKMRKLTNEELKDIGDLLLFGNLDELNKVIADPRETVLRIWFAKIIKRAVENNELDPLETLLDRLVGKTTNETKLDVGGSLHTALVDMIKNLEDKNK